MPGLTVRIVARLRGFPVGRQFGARIAASRQDGTAFPPPFARSVEQVLGTCLAVSRIVRGG